MSLLALRDVKKHFGAQEVLRGATLLIDSGSKVGIVGRNGGGKTTLLRMIAGKESPDWGSVTLRKGARLGSVPQRPQFDPGVTVLEYAQTGLDEVERVLRELERTAELMSEADGGELERLMREHERLTERVEALGGWETGRRVETVLSGIGLPEELWEREARTLSGGEKSRTALARELVGGHDLLLLDEPTNHLDLVGIEWLEDYLRGMVGSVVIVSHDRRLLENSVDAIVELERGQLTRYAGNYSKYIQQKEERYAADMRAWEIQQDFIRREESFIKKHMGSQRTAEAKGRHKKLSHIERLERPFHDVRRPVIRLPQAARGGEFVLQAEDLSGGYPGNVLFEDVQLRVGRGQRIGVVGPNGAGKTTLLQILSGRMEPLAGHVTKGHAAVCAYYDQDTSALRDDHTPIEEVRRDHPQMTDLEARSHLARFLFRGGEVEKPIAALSGGERARICLARLVLTEPTWFALDEPTNHLDLASRTALEETLSEFQGALLCVSHDREFLDGLCDHIIEVGPEGVHEFKGNYTAWKRARDEAQARANEERAERQAAEKKAAREKAAPAKKKNNKKDSGRGKIRNPYMFEKLEKRIMKLEEDLETLQAECAEEEVYLDAERLKDTQIRIAEVENELAVANEEWESWE